MPEYRQQFTEVTAEMLDKCPVARMQVVVDDQQLAAPVTDRKSGADVS
jgi:hypothetical protein